MILTPKQAQFLRGLKLLEHAPVAASEAGDEEIRRLWRDDGLAVMRNAVDYHYVTLTPAGDAAIVAHDRALPVPARHVSHHVYALELDICDRADGDSLCEILLEIDYDYKPPAPPLHSNDTGAGPEITERRFILVLGNVRMLAPSGVVQFYSGQKWDDELIRHAEKERL